MASSGCGATASAHIGSIAALPGEVLRSALALIPKIKCRKVPAGDATATSVNEVAARTLSNIKMRAFLFLVLIDLGNSERQNEVKVD
jgi:hypothetical protein